MALNVYPGQFHRRRKNRQNRSGEIPVNQFRLDDSSKQLLMSEIYFIRHGQASFGQDNYDRLSPLGIIQAQCLAKHLAKTGKTFDGVYYGEMERQQNTAREFINHYSSKGLAVLAPVVSKAFNEYDSFAVWQALIPEMLEDEPAIAKDLNKLPGDQKAFQRIFAPLMTRWITGNYNADGIPRWDDFTRRVKQGIEGIDGPPRRQQKIGGIHLGGPHLSGGADRTRFVR